MKDELTREELEAQELKNHNRNVVLAAEVERLQKLVNCEVCHKLEDLARKQETGLNDLVKMWSAYREMLQKKYPAEEGKEWQFTCEHHQRIDTLLEEMRVLIS